MGRTLMDDELEGNWNEEIMVLRKTTENLSQDRLS
jgi:hypothetical protein